MIEALRVRLQDKTGTGETVLRRTARVLAANGGWEVGGWGILSFEAPSAENPWGDTGIREEDGIFMMRMSAFMSGVALCRGATKEEIATLLQEETVRAWQERQAGVLERMDPL